MAVSLNFTKIKFDNTRVSGSLVVDVDGDLDFSITGSSASQASVSSARKQGGEPTTYTKLEIDDLYVSNLAVQESDLQRTVSVEGGQASNLRFTAQGGTSPLTIKLSDILVSSLVNVDVADDGLLDFSAVGSQCAALSVSTSHYGGGGGSGKVSMQDFHFANVSVQDDGASFDVIATGGHSDSMSIKGESTLSSYTIKLSDVVVSSLVDVDIECDVAIALSIVDSQCAMLSLSSSRAPAAARSVAVAVPAKWYFTTCTSPASRYTTMALRWR